MKPFIMMATSFLLIASLSACGNTVVGVGKDISTMGDDFGKSISNLGMDIMKEEKVAEK